MAALSREEKGRVEWTEERDAVQDERPSDAASGGDGKLADLVVLLFNCSFSMFHSTPFYDQFWTFCMEFGKSATNFDIPAAESFPNGRRNAEPTKLPAVFQMDALSP